MNTINKHKLTAIILFTTFILNGCSYIEKNPYVTSSKIKTTIENSNCLASTKELNKNLLDELKGSTVTGSFIVEVIWSLKSTDNIEVIVHNGMTTASYNTYDERIIDKQDKLYINPALSYICNVENEGNKTIVKFELKDSSGS